MTSSLRFCFSRRVLCAFSIFKFTKLIMAVLVAGLFFTEVPAAHAVFGIRAARSVIAARRAKQAMAKKSDSTAPATETPAEKLQRLETESKGE